MATKRKMTSTIKGKLLKRKWEYELGTTNAKKGSWEGSGYLISNGLITSFCDSEFGRATRLKMKEGEEREVTITIKLGKLVKEKTK